MASYLPRGLARLTPEQEAQRRAFLLKGESEFFNPDTRIAVNAREICKRLEMDTAGMLKWLPIFLEKWEAVGIVDRVPRQEVKAKRGKDKIPHGPYYLWSECVLAISANSEAMEMAVSTSSRRPQAPVEEIAPQDARQTELNFESTSKSAIPMGPIMPMESVATSAAVESVIEPVVGEAVDPFEALIQTMREALPQIVLGLRALEARMDTLEKAMLTLTTDLQNGRGVLLALLAGK